MKDILNRLFEHHTLDRAEAKEVLKDITSQRYPAAQIAAFLAVYRMRMVTVDELEGFCDAMLELALPLPLSGYSTIDLCGTGGDGKHTFNISTVSAFVAAGAGAKVLKHGNYGLSSICGSSNLLEALKVPFPASEAQVRKMLDTAGIAFLHAPLWHPAMKEIAPVRKELAVRTLFNILGPLVNPGRPRAQLVGVFSRELLSLYGALLKRTMSAFAVVHSLDGYDEVSLTGETLVSSARGEERLNPSSFGLNQCTAGDLHAGDSVADAARICLDVLHCRATPAQEGAVLANAGLALSVYNGASLADGVQAAREALHSKRALRTLTMLQEGPA